MRGDLPLCPRFSWLGAGLLAGERPAESLLEPTYKGRRAERPARAFMGANGFTLGLGERFSQESAPIVSTIEQGFRPYNAVIAAGKMRARARPWPIARTLGDFAQNRRPFDELCAGEEMAFVCRKRCETSLPQKAPPAFAIVDRARVTAV